MGKNRFSKALTLLLTCSTVLSLAACGKKLDVQQVQTPTTEATQPDAEPDKEQPNHNIHFVDTSATTGTDADGRPMYTVSLPNLDSECEIEVFENDWYKVLFCGFCTSFTYLSDSVASPLVQEEADSIGYAPGKAMRIKVVNKHEDASYSLVVSPTMDVDGISVQTDIFGTNQQVYDFSLNANEPSFEVVTYREKQSIYDYYFPLEKMFDLVVYIKMQHVDNAPDEFLTQFQEDEKSADASFHVRVNVGGMDPVYYVYAHDDSDKLVFEDDNRRVWLIGHQMFSNEEGKNGYIMRFWFEGDPDSTYDDAVVIPDLEIDGKKYSWSEASIGDYMSGIGFLDLCVYPSEDFAVTEDSVIRLTLSRLNPFLETTYEFTANPETVSVFCNGGRWPSSVIYPLAKP